MPEHLPLPTTAKVDLWGPPMGTPVEGYATSAPRRRSAWGLGDTLWVLFALVATQVVLYAVLCVVVIASYRIQTDQPGAVSLINARVTELLPTGPWLVAAVVLQWSVFIGVPWWVTHRKGHRSLRRDFGFWFKRSDIGYGLGLAWTMQVVLFAVGWALQQTSLDLSGADNTTQVTDHRGWMLAFMVLGAAVAAPITEELLFRGLVLRGMLRRFAKVDHAPLLAGVTDKFHEAPAGPWRKRLGVVAAVVLSSALFGIMHLQTSTGADGQTTITAGHWVVVAQTGLLGLVFAIVAVRTQRLGVTIWAHFFFNSTSLALALSLAAF